MTLIIENKESELYIEDINFYRMGGVINFEINIKQSDLIIEGLLYITKNPRKGWELEDVDYIDEISDYLNEDMIEELELFFSHNLAYII